MPSMNLLTLFNPSNYCRSGYITIPWYPIYQEFQIPPEELVLRDLRELSHAPINAQVDRIDPEDSSRDVLVFLLEKAIPPGADDNTLASGFIRLDRGNPMPAKLGEPSVEIVYGDSGEVRGVRLANNRLIVWFNLIHGWVICGTKCFTNRSKLKFIKMSLFLKQLQNLHLLCHKKIICHKELLSIP